MSSLCTELKVTTAGMRRLTKNIIDLLCCLNNFQLAQPLERFKVFIFEALREGGVMMMMMMTENPGKEE